MKHLIGTLFLLALMSAFTMNASMWRIKGGCVLIQSPVAVAETSEWGNLQIEDGMARKVRPDKEGDKTDVADINIDRTMKSILKEKAPGKNLRRSSWDKKTDPQFLKAVRARFAVNKADMKILKRNGFVVLDKTPLRSYGYAFHEIYQSELPLYVTADSIINTLFLSNDAMMKDMEIKILSPAVKRILDGLREKLVEKAGEYPPDTVKDLDIYCAVALSLLENKQAESKFGNDDAVKDLFDRAMAGSTLDQVNLFGRERMIDFTQFTPRGHYTGEDIVGYFRSAMWLSRLEFNIVSRSCKSSHPGNMPDPAQTPREIIDALALADIAAAAGVTGDIETIDKAWELFAGPREDISIKDIAALRQSAGIRDFRNPGIANTIITTVGDRFKRTVNTHYMPEGTSELPAICTMIGPRVTADTRALTCLIDPSVPKRHMIGIADVVYALGNDRPLHFLENDMRKYPTLEKQLRMARQAVAALSGGMDLYALWLKAITRLSLPPQGAVPSMMKSEAYSDLRLNSMAAAYAQIKHNYVLMAAQEYDFGGCRIPDGYVEPVPELFDALIAYAERAGSVIKDIDPQGTTRAEKYLLRFADIMRVFRVITGRELANRPLTEDMKNFLSMVAELRPGGTGGPATYTGWYFDLFYQRLDALKDSFFIADYYTSARLEQIAYAGVSGLRMGVFVIDTCGTPRLAVGPVPRAFEYTGTLSARLSDEKTESLEGMRRVWASDYTSRITTREPELSFMYDPGSGDREQKIIFYSPKNLGSIEIEFLDHNRKVIANKNAHIGKGKTVVTCKLQKKGAVVELVHIGYGDYHYWSGEIVMGSLMCNLGGCKPPDDFLFY